MTERTAEIQRKTNETKIDLRLSLDPRKVGGYENRTGVGFFDHMLDHVARHGRLGLQIACAGDTHVDDHHTVEDVGIVLGQALDQALGDKRGIERYGSADVPMEDALARVALDLSGRPALVFKVNWTAYGIPPRKPSAEQSEAPDQRAVIPGQSAGLFDVQLVEEFFHAVVNNARLNLHIEVPWGHNNHHIAEAIFKAFGRALRQAVAVSGDEVPSTKGSL
jgi:imidazoleglycerol-phosphate dehydratase